MTHHRVLGITQEKLSQLEFAHVHQKTNGVEKKNQPKKQPKVKRKNKPKKQVQSLFHLCCQVLKQDNVEIFKQIGRDTAFKEEENEFSKNTILESNIPLPFPTFHHISVPVLASGDKTGVDKHLGNNYQFSFMLYLCKILLSPIVRLTCCSTRMILPKTAHISHTAAGNEKRSD